MDIPYRGPVISRLKLISAVIVGIPLYTSHSLLLNVCKINGRIPFNSSSVVLLTECVKLIVSVLCGGWRVFVPSSHGGGTNRGRRGVIGLLTLSSLPYSIPAVLYCINNNLAVLMLHYMDPATFQALGNMKIVMTAILYFTFLNRTISVRQRVSLGILTLAAILNSYGNTVVVDKFSSAPQQTYITQSGVKILAVYCIISAIAGVLTEILMKRNSTSMHNQNTLFYVYGILAHFYGMTYNMYSFKQDFVFNEGSQFFTGFSFWVWVVIFNQAGSGLILSCIMKYSSGLVKMFITTSSIFFNTLVTGLLFGVMVTGYFYVGLFMIAIAIILFYV